MWVDSVLVLLISIGTALLGELLTWGLVYRTEKYQKLKAEVDRQSKRLERKREAHGEMVDRQVKKKMEREEERLKANSRDLQFVKMKSMMAIGFVFTALLSTFNSIFEGRVVAKLPFVPISWLQGISHRNLMGQDPTDCSFLFLYILCTMFVRQNIQKLLGFAPSRAASKQGYSFLSSQQLQSSVKCWIQEEPREMTAMLPDTRYLYNMVGLVTDIIVPCKAILMFQPYNDMVGERALLFSNKLIVNESYLPEFTSITPYVNIGDEIGFDCHRLDEEGPDHCGWYVMKAWYGDRPSAASITGNLGYLTLEDSGLLPARKTELQSMTGMVAELAPRKGVITFETIAGSERVFFLASKVYLYGKRLPTKQHLSGFLHEGDIVQFDASPMLEGMQNMEDESCTWFAKLVWKGKRPLSFVAPETKILIQDPNRRGADESESESDSDELRPDRTTTSLSFLFSSNKWGSRPAEGYGIVQAANSELGILLFQLTERLYETVLFRRRDAFLFDQRLAGKNLAEVFRPGYRVSFEAVKAPLDHPCKWIATKVWFDDE
ncbi:unnamed protein product [Darwinula stevensoni]|uniref:Calcium load-activated calcium channel n=1 Tax=Darwinula stevensoni TaxID=69355 RepID=A0A7R9A6D2_9CRUS|nr:unnamed protein product [Darwinula stevensoni]CAG0888829.1 unnamed protein product [Darwinula stevensoni]